MREQQSKDYTESFMKVATDFMFTQMSAKTGIKKFGEKAVSAMVKQYKQIYKDPMEGKPGVTPIYPDMISYQENRKALESVKLRKYNINVIIKGRTCADGSKKFT